MKGCLKAVACNGKSVLRRRFYKAGALATHLLSGMSCLPGNLNLATEQHALSCLCFLLGFHKFMASGKNELTWILDEVSSLSSRSLTHR